MSAADRAWSALGLARRDRRLPEHGGAFGPAKSWPVEHFASLARRLADEAGFAVLVVCGPANAMRPARSSRGPSSARRQPGRPAAELGLTKACIRRSALLVTTDSGPRHFAAAFGVPVLTLFGPTHIAWTRTYHPHAVHLWTRSRAALARRASCPLGHHRCMRELTPQAVYHAPRFGSCRTPRAPPREIDRHWLLIP